MRLAEAFAKAGSRVILGSRDPRRAERIVRGLSVFGITSGTYEQAIMAEFVVPAMFLRDGMVATLRPYREQLAEKIFIDITNPFNDDYSDFILPWTPAGRGTPEELS